MAIGDFNEVMVGDLFRCWFEKVKRTYRGNTSNGDGICGRAIHMENWWEREKALSK